MDHVCEIARRKVSGPEGWEVCAWERVGDTDDLLVSGGVARVLMSGPRKGQKTWRDAVIQKAVVTRSEIDAEHARYEAVTGRCGDCFGSGEVFASWSAANGEKLKPCKRCGGTGSAPPKP